MEALRHRCSQRTKSVHTFNMLLSVPGILVLFKLLLYYLNKVFFFCASALSRKLRDLEWPGLFGAGSLPLWLLGWSCVQ